MKKKLIHKKKGKRKKEKKKWKKKRKKKNVNWKIVPVENLKINEKNVKSRRKFIRNIIKKKNKEN